MHSFISHRLKKLASHNFQLYTHLAKIRSNGALLVGPTILVVHISVFEISIHFIISHDSFKLDIFKYTKISIDYISNPDCYLSYNSLIQSFLFRIHVFRSEIVVFLLPCIFYELNGQRKEKVLYY